AAATAADLAVGGLLQPERLNRMAELAARDGEALGPAEVLAGLVATAFGAAGPGLEEVSAAIREVVVRRLAALAGDPRAAVTVRALAEETLRGLPPDGGATGAYLARAAERWLERTAPPAAEPAAAPEAPPGAPIGGMPAGGMPALAGCSWLGSPDGDERSRP
ncbi:MAG: hypothetical protein OES32_14890, partial [Acidobacteriota bacterium]|nr:hypothetical protein [Acidobacteriota bacterium]